MRGISKNLALAGSFGACWKKLGICSIPCATTLTGLLNASSPMHHRAVRGRKMVPLERIELSTSPFCGCGLSACELRSF